MIIIIPCGGKKQERICKAEDMYTGQYHILCQAYAKTLTNRDNIYILSAKYGLLTLDEEIEPYNIRMGDSGSISLTRLLSQKEKFQLTQEEVTALGGRDYTSICRTLWEDCETPMAGLGGIGKQIQWLKQQLEHK